MNQRRHNEAFTLIELLVVIAIIAILAAILFPVFAQAKVSAKTTATLAQIKQQGLAAIMYSNDFDDGTVLTDSGPGYAIPTWAGLQMPYVKNQQLFWDATRAVPNASQLQGYDWTQVTTLAINDSGFSGYWNTDDGTCSGNFTTYTYGRTMTALENISSRVIFAPVVWGGTGVGWYYFRAYEANWIDPGVTIGGWSWYNEVYDTRGFYSGYNIPVARADGSAGKIKRGDFIDWNQAPGTAEYCAWDTTVGMKVWGPFWNAN